MAKKENHFNYVLRVPYSGESINIVGRLDGEFVDVTIPFEIGCKILNYDMAGFELLEFDSDHLVNVYCLD